MSNPDDYPNDTTTSASIALTTPNTPVSITGNIENYFDSDWFKINLTASNNYVFNLEGSPTQQGTLSDPYLYLYTASSVLLASNDDAGVGYNARLIFTPSLTADYYLVARAYDAAETGTYTLTAMYYLDDYSANTNTTGQLTLLNGTGEVTGNLTEADSDWFAISLQAGTSYNFQFNSSASISINLHNATGDLVSISYYGSNQSRFTALSSGTYYVGVTANFSANDNNINYTLTASTLSNINTITGTANNDTLSGDVLALNSYDTLVGLAGNDLLQGLGGNDSLDAGAGDDTLNGGTGTDTLNGGAGNDSYLVDGVDDVIIETDPTSSEIDTVLSAASYTLADNIENLSLVGTSPVSGTGNALANTLWGNVAHNTLTGLAGNDLLLGLGGNDSLDAGLGDDTLNGGTGTDTLNGGAGNDTYRVNSSDDVITETNPASSEIDTVWSSVTYSLSANLERLRLTSSMPVSGEGNASANVIIGNQGNNLIDGNGGDDLIYGNGGNDTLQGDTGSDTLYGLLGDDALLGGVGDDTYHINSSNDHITENAGEGSDKVNSSINYTLGDNLEKLHLLGAANQATGNALNNALVGSDNNDTLQGNAGNDHLVGGQGADVFNGGAGRDAFNLIETTPAGDTLIIAAGDSLVSSHDIVRGFHSAITASDLGVDKLDLNGAIIAADITSSADSGTHYKIHSHSIHNGMIQFSSGHDFNKVLSNETIRLNYIISYLETNITAPEQTVAFTYADSTYVFANMGDSHHDTLIQLIGLHATGLSATGLVANTVWVN